MNKSVAEAKALQVDATPTIFLNGRRVTRERLVDGAVIKLGDSEFSYSSRENKVG